MPGGGGGTEAEAEAGAGRVCRLSRRGEALHENPLCGLVEPHAHAQSVDPPLGPALGGHLEWGERSGSGSGWARAKAKIWVRVGALAAATAWAWPLFMSVATNVRPATMEHK